MDGHTPPPPKNPKPPPTGGHRSPNPPPVRLTLPVQQTKHPQELFKYLALRFCTLAGGEPRNPHTILIYLVAAAAGFACCENVCGFWWCVWCVVDVLIGVGWDGRVCTPTAPPDLDPINRPTQHDATHRTPTIIQIAYVFGVPSHTHPPHQRLTHHNPPRIHSYALPTVNHDPNPQTKQSRLPTSSASPPRPAAG